MSDLKHFIPECPLCNVYLTTKWAFFALRRELALQGNAGESVAEVHRALAESIKDLRKAGKEMLLGHPRCKYCTALLGRGHDERYMKVKGGLVCESCAGALGLPEVYIDG